MPPVIFSPSFGNRPSQLVGRESYIDALIEGLQTPAGSKERATLILGQRGSGKTVLLWELADRARELGYVVATPTVCTEGMNERIIEKIQEDGEHYVKGKRGHIVGGSIAVFGFTVGLEFDKVVQETKSFSYKLINLARVLNDQGHGILILIDEVQANSSELRMLVSTYLELVGEGCDVAIVMAGLPGAISAMLNDKVLTFFNRANKVDLGPLDIDDVDLYYKRVFKKLKFEMKDEVRRRAAESTYGSPYMMQLIGYNILRYAGDANSLDDAGLEEALKTSMFVFEQDVCKTTIAALSGQDVSFLEAMSEDDGPSRIREIADRMGVSEDYAQKYRKRLIDAGVIEAERRGYVRFAVPFLKEYLRNS